MLDIRRIHYGEWQFVIRRDKKEMYFILRILFFLIFLINEGN
ncbi:hypothetical protein XSR1_670012 [Xenorhabdus szentirmaii DSM 16338]|uniref:Uncharacterized protein n=1 Tax=Xenorhabdus szentirmaii DSM 16338 TaxID=1427518 RepID=W1J5T4_9GAMM|nr:hypothetical protein XSR1_670012 [Xenorhabdus szentirmaii DSM 16338]